MDGPPSQEHCRKMNSRPLHQAQIQGNTERLDPLACPGLPLSRPGYPPHPLPMHTVVPLQSLQRYDGVHREGIRCVSRAHGLRASPPRRVRQGLTRRVWGRSGQLPAAAALASCKAGAPLGKLRQTRRQEPGEQEQEHEQEQVLLLLVLLLLLSGAPGSCRWRVRRMFTATTPLKRINVV